MAEDMDYSNDDYNAQDAAADKAQADSALSREQLRKAMQSDVEAFLARGGKIQKIDNNVMADPPRKPQSSYGSRPI
ncbi:hypothetical protein CHH28_05440 [Bacterioplanes sanyensis]|uniref:Transcriptional regulator SutA RNAP-binding domain-containing protein n=1 Tax=Bacterioplanes sanyensis TaxID=1249553 RepID=A0A222FIB9_9GAMM|nr:hypothetical protein [Bacterioplanes sanyensis]ASP38161.1 hypothetical protein CHH28_05440 [Bacterioplanes sanyensis]